MNGAKRLIRVVCGFFVLLTVAASSAWAATEHGSLHFEEAFGSKTYTDFGFPSDLVLDGDGNIWVLDRGTERIQLFNTRGEYLGGFGAGGPEFGHVTRPMAIAMNSAGDIWIADTGNDRIEKFVEGQAKDSIPPGSRAGQVLRPQGVAIDAEGDIWVSDTGNHRLQEFDERGTFIRVVERSGSFRPTALDVAPNGDVWVIDAERSGVVVFGQGGEVVRRLEPAKAEPGAFIEPSGIDVDASGNVWIADRGRNQILRFDESGDFIGSFGSARGSQPGQFDDAGVLGLEADESGRIWVTDPGNSRVQGWGTRATGPEGRHEGSPPSEEATPGGGQPKTMDMTLDLENLALGYVVAGIALLLFSGV